MFAADLGAARRKKVKDDLERAGRLLAEGIAIIIASIDDVADADVAEPLLAQSRGGVEVAINAEAVAAHIGRNASTIREMARLGAIPAHAIGGTGDRKEWRFYLSEIDAWIRDTAGAHVSSIVGRTGSRRGRTTK